MLNGKRIVIYSWAGLGDTIMFTPSLRRIKQRYPSCTISFITKEINRSALKGLPYIDHIYTCKRKSLCSKIKLIPVLARQDYVVFTDWQPQLAVLSKLLCVPHVSGKTRKNHLSEKLFERHIENWVLDTSDYAADTINHALSLVLNVRIDADTKNIDVALPTEIEVKKVDAYMETIGRAPADPYLCLALFTGLEERNWPVKQAKELIGLIENDLHIPVILIGPPGKTKEAEGIGGINLVGKTSFGEMVELIRRSQLFIGPDSGTMHVAGALGTPQIALFSNDLPSRWAPGRNCHAISLQLPCVNCHNEGIQSCMTRKCNRGITSAMVFETIKAELKKNEAHAGSHIGTV